MGFSGGGGGAAACVQQFYTDAAPMSLAHTHKQDAQYCAYLQVN